MDNLNCFKLSNDNIFAAMKIIVLVSSEYFLLPDQIQWWVEGLFFFCLLFKLWKHFNIDLKLVKFEIRVFAFL
jgi:hypothetical protein